MSWKVTAYLIEGFANETRETEEEFMEGFYLVWRLRKDQKLIFL